MKTKCKQVFKILIAFILAVLMIVGTTATGFAATRNIVSTSWNMGKIYYVNIDNWSEPYMLIWGSGDYDAKLTKITNTNIYYYTSGYNNYGGFKFHDGKGTWDKQSTGNIETDTTGSAWFYGTSTSKNTDMGQLNGTAYVTTMISYNGGSSYSAVANSNTYTSISGKNLVGGNTSTSESKGDTKTNSEAKMYPAYGSSYTMTATAGTGYTFKGFSNTKKTNGLPSSLSSGSTKTCTSYQYGGSSETNDTWYAYYNAPVASKGSDVTGGTYSVTNNNNGTFSLSALPANGYTFSGWTISNGQTATGSSTTFTPTSDCTVTANFTENKYTVSVAASPSAGGTVSITPDGEDNVGTVTSATIYAVANEGYSFNGWTSENDNVEFDDESLSTTAITATGDDTVIANFVLSTQKITVTNPAPKSASVAIDGTPISTYTGDIAEVDVEAGSQPVVSITNNNSNLYYTVKQGGTVKIARTTDNDDYIMDAVSSPQSIAVEYSADVSFDKNGHGDGDTPDTQDVAYNSVATDPGALSETGYTFGGWYANQECSGSAYDFLTPVTQNITLYAKWTENTYSVRFNKNNDSATGSMSDETFTYEETKALTANSYVLNGYVFYKWNTEPDGTGDEYDDGYEVSQLSEIDNDVITLYAQWTPRVYDVVVKDTSQNEIATDTWTYGQTTTIDDFDIESTQYISAITSSSSGLPAQLSLDIQNQSIEIPTAFTYEEVDTITITVVVVNKNVVEEVGADNIKVSGKVNDGYIPGIEVGITYTAKSGTAITDAKLYTDSSCTTLYTGSELTISGNTSEYTLVGTMPASDIYVKFETESSCSLYYEGYVYNPKVLSEPAFTSDIATITATYGEDDTPVTSPVNVVEGNCVNLTVSNINSGYTFQGWVQGSPKGSVLAKPESGDAYTIYPSGDTKLYAIFTKDVYLAYSSSSSGTYTKYQNKMNFDVSTATYVDSINFENTSKYIKIYDENNNNDATSNATKGTPIGVTFDMYNTKTSYAYCKISGLSSGYADPISVFLNVSNRSKPVINAKASVASPKVFLSSGRLTINNAIGAVSAFTDGLGSPSSTDDEDAKIVKKKGETSTTVERYVSATLDGAQSVSVQTQIQSADYTVEAFVVYDATKSKAYALSGSEIKNLGNNTFGATVDVTGNTYICPVFVNSESYYSSHTDVTKVKLYVDTASIANLSSYQWGPLVAGYVWGNEATVGNFGEWPGQLLVPDKTGEKFYCYINKSGSTTITGITLNNYCTSANSDDTSGILQGTAVGCEKVLNNGLTELQTYDYADPICLQKDGYDEITFVAKENLDGYHGNATYAEGRTGDRIPSDGIASHATSTSTITAYPFKFDYLKYRNGVSNMSLTGNKLEGEDDPLFYIVAAEYAYNDGKEDHWPVKWYIYDENKKYVLNCNSSDLYDKADPDDTNTKLITSLLSKGYTLQELTDSPVMITYERTNMSKAKSVYRFDGQWYGSKSTDEITLTTKVGLIDANNNYIVSNSNIEYYGKSAFLSGEIELSTITVEKSDSVTLNATPLSYEGVSYRFVGYYTRNASGMLNQVSTSATYTPVLQDDETYYAFFKEIGTGSFSVNLKPYTYQAESAISSHLGTSSLNVSIYNYTGGEKGTLINSGDLSTQGSYAEIAYEENKEYLVEISSDPSGEDNFFAWYTDSVDAQGNSTYEEILTDESQVGSKDKVTSSFIWSYNVENPTSINIYADVQKVSVDVTYQFQYIGRNGSIATFTISSDKNNKGASVIDPSLALTSTQLSGQDPENGYQKYYPKYKTRFVLNDDKIVYGYAEYLQALKDGKTMKSESNFATAMIEKFKIDVHGNTVSWSDEDNNVKYFIPMDSRLIVVARQVVPTYTLKASYYSGGKFIEDVTTYADQPYNTLASFDLESIDAEKDGKPFAYWKNVETGEFITYVRNYGRRITENIEIEAVYGEKLNAWLPKIDTLQLTRELSDTSDYTYADFTLNYLSQDGKVLKDQTDSSYGLILVRKNIVVDPDKDIDKDAKKITDATIESKSSDVRTSVNSGNLLIKTINEGASTAFNSSGTKISKPSAATDSLCYFFDLTSKLDLTSYNRANYMMGFNNKSSSYINFYFVAYAWVKIGSEIHIYEAGSKNLCMYNTANGL